MDWIALEGREKTIQCMFVSKLKPLQPRVRGEATMT